MPGSPGGVRVRVRAPRRRRRRDRGRRPGRADLANAPPSLLSRSMETLENIGDLDYLTHIVFRMYERFDFAPTDPRRFRVEILLSTGVGLDPFKRNVIQEFEKAAADAHRREKASVSPGAVTGQRRKSEDAASLPLVRQFPVQRPAKPQRAADQEARGRCGGGKGEGAGQRGGEEGRTRRISPWTISRRTSGSSGETRAGASASARGGGTGPPRATGRGARRRRRSRGESPSRRRSGRNRTSAGPSEARSGRRKGATARASDETIRRRERREARRESSSVRGRDDEHYSISGARSTRAPRARRPPPPLPRTNTRGARARPVALVGARRGNIISSTRPRTETRGRAPPTTRPAARPISCRLRLVIAAMSDVQARLSRRSCMIR